MRQNQHSHYLSRIFVTLLLSVAVATAGCATLRRGAASALLPVEQEIKLGKQLSAEIEEELTLHPSSAVQQRIAALGRQVVAAAPDRHRDMEFTFKVVDDPDTINAFALPGGWIYIYSGLLLAAESEAEVVGVLAHEVAHVTRRHIAERLATAYGVQTLTALALGKEPAMLGQLVAGVLGTGYLLRFSREQEIDADVTGVNYVISAGWRPHGFINFFERLGGDREAGSRRALGWISTHPMPEDRIVHVREAIEAHGTVPAKLGTEEHQQLLAMLGGASTPPSSPARSTEPADVTPPSDTTGSPAPGRRR